MHMGSNVPFPKGTNDWKTGIGGKKLTESERGDIRGDANKHCVLSGQYAVGGGAENGHEYAHVIPSATAVDAFAAFVEAANAADPTFPVLDSLSDHKNIIYIIIMLRRAIDAETVGIYLPLADKSPIDNYPDIDIITAPILELHHWTGLETTTLQEPHQKPLKMLIERINRFRLLAQTQDDQPPPPAAPHKCDEDAAFSSWFTSRNPYLPSSPYPHPILLKLHYGVFVAQNFSSDQLKAIALGRKRRKGDGGNDGGGHGKGDGGEGGRSGKGNGNGNGGSRKRARKDQNNGDEDDNKNVDKGRSSGTTRAGPLESSDPQAEPADFASADFSSPNNDNNVSSPEIPPSTELGVVPMSRSADGSNTSSGSTNSTSSSSSGHPSMSTSLTTADEPDSEVKLPSIPEQGQGMSEGCEEEDEEEEEEEEGKQEARARHRVEWFNFALTQAIERSVLLGHTSTSDFPW